MIRARMTAPNDDRTARIEPGLDARSIRLRHAFCALPPERRTVLELLVFEGLSQGQIAQRLTLSHAAVRARLRLGMRQLVESLPAP